MLRRLISLIHCFIKGHVKSPNNKSFAFLVTNQSDFVRIDFCARCNGLFGFLEPTKKPEPSPHTNKASISYGYNMPSYPNPADYGFIMAFNGNPVTVSIGLDLAPEEIVIHGKTTSTWTLHSGHKMSATKEDLIFDISQNLLKVENPSLLNVSPFVYTVLRGNDVYGVVGSGMTKALQPDGLLGYYKP
jgi:hypothetical protein